MNKMPEVAKCEAYVCGVDFIVECDTKNFVDDALKIPQGHIMSNSLIFETEDAVYQMGYEVRIEACVNRVKWKEPRYTIPEDLEVDAKVWVRDSKEDDWKPAYFSHIQNASHPYVYWADGKTSYTKTEYAPRDKHGCNFCITDEDYQEKYRKE